MLHELTGLSAWYGEAQALRDVEPGRSAPARSSPWSGRNGAGKTTLLRCRDGPAPARSAARSTLDGTRR